MEKIRDHKLSQKFFKKIKTKINFTKSRNEDFYFYSKIASILLKYKLILGYHTNKIKSRESI